MLSYRYISFKVDWLIVSSQLYFTINLEEIFYFGNKKCRIYAAFGVSQTPIIREEGKEREVLPEEMGYVLSTPAVPEFLTGREFLKFFMEINRDSIRRPKTIDAYFDQVGIAPEDRDRLLKDYSHGMKNKMQMLVQIIARPSILLLDEPLTSLDVVAAEEMKQLLRSQKEERILIFSTHIMELALDLCDAMGVLHQGILEEIRRDNLDQKEFRERILEMLREG